MGKKVFSLCMALALCLGLLPATALAVAPDEQVLCVGNVQISSTGYWTTDSEGNVTAYSGTEAPTDNYIHYNKEANTLTLHNATIKKGLDYSEGIQGGTYIPGSAIGVLNLNGDAELTITLAGTNTIEDVSTGIFVLAHSSSTGDASLTITGSGSLTASGNINGINVQSNSGDATLTIQSADVTLTSNSGNGVTVQAGSTNSTGEHTITLSVEGGSLTASGSTGISFDSASSYTVSDTNLTVSNNAIVRANYVGSNISNVDLQIGKGNNSSGGIVFDGKNGTVYGEVTLQEDLEIGEGESLTLDDDATLDANGHNVIVDGGTLDESLANSLGDRVKYAPTITTTSPLSNGTVGTYYEQTLAADGTTPITWSVDSDSLPTGLSLDASTGMISGTPTAEGVSTFTVEAANDYGSDSREFTLSIDKPVVIPVTGVKLDKTSLTLQETGSATLTATVEPDNATNKNVNWESSDTSIATVDASGKVTAISAGSATITATAADGSGVSATCAVTVTAPPEPTPPPYIPPSKPNWTSVARKLANAQPGDTVTVKMNGETEVPGDVWETIAGRDVTVVLDMGGNVSWTVDGNDVPTATHFADMDFGVDRNTTGIDVDVINAITGQVSSVQITLAHDGAFGFTLTLTAPLGKENAGYWANLYHYDEENEILNYETSGEIQEDGTASLKMTHASQYAIIIDDQAHQLPFTDVTSGTWYEGAVRYVYLHDIMEGMSETEFAPATALTRAMAVQIFYNLEGQPDISDENLGYPYEDVNALAWYGDAVYWARITGVATGYGDGTFQPTDSITRQEFAQMLYNYAKYKDYDLSAEGDLSQFPDSGSVADWAEAAMIWANSNELINGHDDGTIDAAGIGTRAQAASILMRFDENVTE